MGDNADCAPNDPLVTAPSCTGKDCGDDGCGGSCGTCGVGFTCTEFKCMPVQQGANCGDTTGLQAGAPWPMTRGCPVHTGRTPYSPADKLKTKWTFPTTDEVKTAPVVAADGTIYAASSDKKVYAVGQK